MVNPIASAHLPGLSSRNPLDPHSLAERKEKLRLAANTIDSIAKRSGANETVKMLRDISQSILNTGLPTLTLLLPALLKLKGRPYTVERHYPFEPFFNTFMPRNLVLKTGRQVSKSTSLAAQGVVLSNCIPYFNTLYVTPLFEMIRRFSNNYVRGFIDESPVKNLWTSSTTSSNVLQRSFTNKSNMFFSYAFLDADRTRGLNCSKCSFDESVKAGTLVSRPMNSSKAIEKLEKGEEIYSINEFGEIVTDRVKAVSDHGTRNCFKISLNNGKSFECTAESYVATTIGWKRVSTLIEVLYAHACKKAYYLTGDIPGITRVRDLTTVEDEEQELVAKCKKLKAIDFSLLSCYSLSEVLQTRNCELTRDVSVTNTPGFLADAERHTQKNVRTEIGFSPLKVQISSIEHTGKHKVYDLETEGHHTFFASDIAVHNCQDLDASFIPIIRETMSGSPYGDIVQYAGTPKTLDNTLEGLWQRSSQAEWVITCPVCFYENVPAMTHDLDKMIGPWSADIGPNRSGVLCARPSCRRPIDPRTGMWYHAYPERAANYAGYHVPQIIMPMHCFDKDKWQILAGKRDGWFGTPKNVFYNEVCGESFDTGLKLVTLSELKAVANLGPNTVENAKHVLANNDYVHRILSVDWGGGGEDETSFTTYAVLGLRTDMTIDVVYGHRSMTPHDFNAESRLCLDMVSEFGCSHIIHDYNGAGAYREKYIIDAGFPYLRVIPIQYVPAASQSIMHKLDASDKHPRIRYSVDKARSLVLTCHQIKSAEIRMFDYDGDRDDNTGLIRDFLALVEDKVSTKGGRDLYKIIRQQNMTDDFAQAVNMGCCALWYMTKAWPNVAAADRYRISQEVIDAMSVSHERWDDPD